MKSTASWVPAYMDIEWTDRYASAKRRFGDTAKFDALLEEGLALWKTMGQMQPEDVQSSSIVGSRADARRRSNPSRPPA